MSRAPACFLSAITAHHQYCGARYSALQTPQFSTKNHQPIRCGDATSSFFHKYKQYRSTTASSWSLQTQQDDNNNNTSPRKRRRRQARDTNTDDDDDISDIITSILFKHVSVPFSTIGTYNRRQTVPTIYPLGLIAAFAFLPPITSTMIVLFFGLYLALLLPILAEYDDVISLDEQNDDDDERKIVAPSVSFMGAVASAALLSPQGLIVPNEKGLLSSAVPSYYLFAVLVVALGGYVLLQGVNETAKDTRQWEGEEMDALSEKEERSVMNQWDDELKEKEDV